MKLRPFVPSIILFHIAIIFLHIYRHNEYVKYSFAKQKAEQQYTTSSKRKNECEQAKCLLANLTAIKEYAERKLGMKPISISQIKRVSNDQSRP